MVVTGNGHGDGFDRTPIPVAGHLKARGLFSGNIEYTDFEVKEWGRRNHGKERRGQIVPPTHAGIFISLSLSFHCKAATLKSTQFQKIRGVYVRFD